MTYILSRQSVRDRSNCALGRVPGLNWVKPKNQPGFASSAFFVTILGKSPQANAVMQL